MQQALWIDVPFIQQDKNGCGSASIWMVLEYWKPGAAPPVQEIHAQLYSEEAGGIFARDMIEYLEARGHRAFAFRGEWDDLTRHVAKGRPLIVCLERNRRGVPLHYVVVAGVDPVQNLVLINDPAQRKLLSMARSEFEQRWAATDNWTLLAVPEIELASAAFREERLTETREHLRSALEVDSRDTHTNDFLATVYFLQNNTEAALKYWNRGGKPRIENIRIDPPLRTDPVLLDRAFTFSRGDVLTLEDFRTTQARLEATDVFSRQHMELSAADGDRFEVTLRAAERNGAHFLAWLRGLPYQTLYPGLFNLNGKMVHLTSMVRWDPNKRRANVALAAPLNGEPKWRFRAGLDAREETWIDQADSFRMTRFEAIAEMQAVPSSRWNWTTGVAVSRRQFSNSFSSGAALKSFASATRVLLRDSERRLTVKSSMSFQAGKAFAQDRSASAIARSLKESARFVKAEHRLSATWKPFSDRPDYELAGQWRAGRAFGRPPFDEWYMFGLDRDSDIWLRAHAATVRGRKNAAFVARSFMLTKVDFLKSVHDSAFFRLSAGSFIDAARAPAHAKWLVDSGVQIRFTVLGSLTMDVSFGKSLTDGGRAFFVSAPR
jgi:predicted double-glycine peptidase